MTKFYISHQPRIFGQIVPIIGLFLHFFFSGIWLKFRLIGNFDKNCLIGNFSKNRRGRQHFYPICLLNGNSQKCSRIPCSVSQKHVLCKSANLHENENIIFLFQIFSWVRRSTEYSM